MLFENGVLKKQWARAALKDQNFVQLQLYLSTSQEYKDFQKKLFPGRQGAPHYIVLNAKGEIVQDTQNIKPFGVVLGSTKPEDEKETIFKRFLGAVDGAGTAIDLEKGW